MPKRILLIGLLFCAGGGLAIWQVISDLMSSHINVNLAVFLLPVGIGLLRGKARSQWWARFWIIIGYVGCGLLAILVLASPQNAHVNWFGKELRGSQAAPWAMLAAVILALILAGIHRLLYSQPACVFFQRDCKHPAAE